jgi:hypothetical protein
MEIIIAYITRKAFDSIENKALYMVLRRMGFPELFISWAKSLLETGTSAFLVNGVPGRNFRCKRGVRHGDHLSPLLFVLGQSYCNILLMISKIKGCYTYLFRFINKNFLLFSMWLTLFWFFGQIPRSWQFSRRRCMISLHPRVSQLIFISPACFLLIFQMTV